MTTRTVAYRLGTTAGLLARVVLHARNPAVRWVKRAVVVGGLLWLVAANAAWIVGTVMTIGAFGLLLWAIGRGDDSALVEAGHVEVKTEGYEYGLQGYGYYVRGQKMHFGDEPD